MNSATVNSSTISLENEVGQVRNELIVAAALIAAATYQALLSPPESIKHEAILVAFICVNTIACLSSATIIEYMSGLFPYQREIRLSYFAFGVSAGIAGAHDKNTKSTQGLTEKYRDP
ncbi:ankyrin repeat-containing protein BDA1-like protein isoform X1 [Tanacetum coccineum]